MLVVDALDNNTQLNNTNATSTRRTSGGADQAFRIMENYYEIEDEQDDSPTTTAAIHQLDIDNYLIFGVDRSNESCSSNASSSHDQECNPLHFWKHHHSSYPRLARIAKRVFSVPATSAAVEREFSLAGNIVTKKRSRLAPETVNDIIFQNSFERYCKKNIQIQ
jgi:hypothetical protein